MNPDFLDMLSALNEAACIGKEDLIANKLAVGRPQDLADVAALREADEP